MSKSAPSRKKAPAKAAAKKVARKAAKKAAKKASVTRRRAAKKAPAKRPVGRPSLYSDEVLEAICSQLEQGIPLAQICRAPGMPAARTVSEWTEKDEGIAAAIARARALGEDELAAQCLEIANTPQMGVIEKLAPLDGEAAEGLEAGELVVVERKIEDMLGHRKLQIDTRLKLLAKWNPKKWGDRQVLEHDVSDDLAERMRMARERAARG